MSHLWRYHFPMVQARTTVGRKGRTVIPAAARQAAGIEEGQELVVLTDAPGRLVLMTRDAIQGEVWRAAADMSSDIDAVADVRAMRREDATIADAAEERARRQGRETGGGIDAVGLELLRHLGIDESP
jgi:AbrB family looped-hinge helix DNA binding protein